MIPTPDECYALMDRYQMLDNVREHSVVVARIVEIISQELVQGGVRISVEKAVAGALLHDIAKTECLKSGRNHAALGKDICLQHRLDDIADIVAEHVRLNAHSPDGTISEKEIVYYADKRVLHTSVVSLEERLLDILDRYGKDNPELRQRIRDNFKVCQTVERKIFAKLEFEPDDLAGIHSESPRCHSERREESPEIR